MTFAEALDELTRRSLIDRVQVLTVTDGKVTLQLGPPPPDAYQGDARDPETRKLDEEALVRETMYDAARGYIPGADA